MKDEINAAVKFIIKLIKQNSKANEENLGKFQRCLKFYLAQKFSNHWHPEKPWQGQGYRCLRINGTNGKEPSIAKAASDCGLKYSDLKLPLELTVWVDPDEVCCRFGEHKGSYCTIASFKKGKEAYYNDNIDIIKVANTNCAEDGSNIKNCSKRVTSPKFVSSTNDKFSSKKENISPVRKQHTSQYNRRAHPSNEELESAYKSSTSISNRASGSVFNAHSPLMYKEQNVKNMYQGDTSAVPFFSHMENTSPYYKPSSWIGYPVSVSPPQPSFSSNCYYNYSPPHYSSQDNLNFNRISPVLSKMRWNSSPFTAGNAYQRNGWYMQRQLARV